MEEVAAEEKPKKIKTRAEVNTVNDGSDWSQEQQRALEAALTKYPKGASIDRWEKIANCVEGKTKVCIKNKFSFSVLILCAYSL